MKTAFLSLILLTPMFAFANMPDFPMAFWGTATVDGVTASAGSVIRVYSEQVKVGESVVQNNGVYGYTEPTKQKLVIGEGGSVLTFTIQGTSINGGVETSGVLTVTHPGFASGETIHKDLRFTTKTVTSGGGSSGGGGGGGGSSSKSDKKTKTESPKRTPELVLGSATTTALQEDQKIALQKQIIILLTQIVALLQMKLAL